LCRAIFFLPFFFFFPEEDEKEPYVFSWVVYVGLFFPPPPPSPFPSHSTASSQRSKVLLEALRGTKEKLNVFSPPLFLFFLFERAERKKYPSPSKPTSSSPFPFFLSREAGCVKVIFQPFFSPPFSSKASWWRFRGGKIVRRSSFPFLAENKQKVFFILFPSPPSSAHTKIEALKVLSSLFVVGHDSGGEGILDSLSFFPVNADRRCYQPSPIFPFPPPFPIRADQKGPFSFFFPPSLDNLVKKQVKE